MTQRRRWAEWLRALVDELDRTPEEILSARLDRIEEHLRELQSDEKTR